MLKGHILSRYTDGAGIESCVQFHKIDSDLKILYNVNVFTKPIINPTSLAGAR